MQTFTLTEAANNLGQIQRELLQANSNSAVLLTRHGRPVLALVEVWFLRDVLQTALTAFAVKDARSLMDLTTALAPLTNTRTAVIQTKADLLLDEIQAALDSG